MADEQDRLAGVPELSDLVQALALEVLVAHRQDLVDEEYVRVDVHRDRETEADVLPRRVVLHRVVDLVRELSESDDGVEQLVRLTAGEAEQAGVEIDVVPAGELAVEA